MVEKLMAPSAIRYAGAISQGTLVLPTNRLNVPRRVRVIFLFRSVPTRHVPNDRETSLLVQGRHAPSKLRSTNAPHLTRQTCNLLRSAEEPSSASLFGGFQTLRLIHRVR